MKMPGMLHHGRKQRGFKRFQPPTSLRRSINRLEPTVLSLQRRFKRLQASPALQRRSKQPEPPPSPLQRRIERLEPTVSALQRRLERLEPAVSRLRRTAAARRLTRGGFHGIHIGNGLHRIGRGGNRPAGRRR